MNTLRQAAQQALVALKESHEMVDNMHCYGICVDAIADLKKALEQSEQVTAEAIHATWSAGFVEGEKSALAKTEQEPFGYFRADAFGWTDCAEGDEGAVALYERPHVAQPEQEPKHVVKSNGRHSPLLTHMMNKRYTTPLAAQQRKPLTNEEITKAFNEAMAKRPKDASNAEINRLFVRAIEAAHGIKEQL